MACYTNIYSVSNNIKKLNIQSDLYFGYINNFYQDKQFLLMNCFLNTLKAY